MVLKIITFALGVLQKKIAISIIMDYNRFLKLLAKKKSGELSLPELKELKIWLENNPEYEAYAQIIDEVYKTALNTVPDLDNESVQRQWGSLQKKINKAKAVQPGKTKRLRLNWVYVAAACMLGIILARFYYFNLPDEIHRKENILSTKKGSKTNLVLPDGSMVWLNADSKLSYNEDFGKQGREINLSGEAYFDVVKNPGKPFIVHTPVLDVKVLGTTFNVKAYQNDNSTEATLIKGSVEVILKNDARKTIVLKPREKLSVLNKYVVHTTDPPPISQSKMAAISIIDLRTHSNDSTITETQWVQNRLAFNNKRLDEIAVQLERWYGGIIEITDESLKSKEYSGSFEDESLPQVMEALRLTGGFHYKLDKKKIIIFP